MIWIIILPLLATSCQQRHYPTVTPELLQSHNFDFRYGTDRGLRRNHPVIHGAAIISMVLLTKSMDLDPPRMGA